MLLITSVNPRLFELYGRRMIEEFSDNSDGSVRLCVVFEGDSVPTQKFQHVDFIKFFHPGHEEFIRKFGKLHEARGLRIEFKSATELNIYPDFRFDAIRFSFKVFAILQTLESKRPEDHFAWIDADVRCLKKISRLDLLEFFPKSNQVMSYLGRTKFPLTGPYSECGFLGFNSEQVATKQFLLRMAEVYTSGEVFSHNEWHDSWLWDQIRIEFEASGHEFKNISGAAENTHHPFINSGLGAFFDHLKGPKRKKNGRSFSEDYLLSKAHF